MSKVVMDKSGAGAPTVSIAIPTFNSAWSLPQVLDALLRFEYDRRFLRVIFVDGESTDGTGELIAKFAEIHGHEYESVVTLVARSGISRGRNICIEKAAGTDFLFFLDSDVVAGPETLGRLLAHLTGEKGVGMASLPYDSENSRGKFGVLVRAFNTPTGPAKANKVAGGCVLIPMEVVRRVGPFNESLRYLEDGEYCYRVRSAGYEIVCDFSYPAKHLKQISMGSASYARFVLDSASFYVVLARMGSPVYLARYATSFGLIVALALLLARPGVASVAAFALLAVAAVAVNSSDRLWGDGSTIKLRYKPLVGVVFSAVTVVIALASIPVLFRKRAAPSRPAVSVSVQSASGDNL